MNFTKNLIFTTALSVLPLCISAQQTTNPLSDGSTSFSVGVAGYDDNDDFNGFELAYETTIASRDFIDIESTSVHAYLGGSAQFLSLNESNEDNIERHQVYGGFRAELDKNFWLFWETGAIQYKQNNMSSIGGIDRIGIETQVFEELLIHHNNSALNGVNVRLAYEQAKIQGNTEQAIEGILGYKSFVAIYIKQHIDSEIVEFGMRFSKSF